MDNKKRNLSIRLSESDIKKIKDISGRLGVTESELFRFAVKNMLTKLITLSDQSIKGQDLIPTWLECGRDLLVHFDIDVDRLNEIFNTGIQDRTQGVASEDLDLMILSYFNENYAIKKLSEFSGMSVAPGEVTSAMHRYLHDKYVSLKYPASSRPVNFKSVGELDYMAVS